MERIRCDVAIIGGGPAGSTAGTLLKKYSPGLRVMLFERERFPRDHVGESQLPAIMTILAEMGAWEKVEAANFPIKLGAAYRWGATDELWYLNFIEPANFVSKERPERFEGQRQLTAFQVDRSIYDKILLDHAQSSGCEVYEESAVRVVESVGDFVTGLKVASEELGGEVEVKAKFYVDASGESGILRRKLGVATDIPTALRNLAFWDYWQDADWAETIGKGATRIQVMSLGWGWIWFIPITPTRTSIGLVVPGEYYKKSGKRPEQLYHEAIQAEPLVSSLVRNATCENRHLATKDWNFLAERLAGENWFMAGDSCGFADPILSAGMTLAHVSGQRVAYSILELMRKNLDPKWIREHYSTSHREQIRQHMRFAEFWYAGNGRFTDLKEYCSEIASHAGLSLDAEEAFYWLSTGGFALDQPGRAGAATFPLVGVKRFASRMTGATTEWRLSRFNRLKLHLEGATEEPYAIYENGAIQRIVCLVRDGKKLPLIGFYSLIVRQMQHSSAVTELIHGIVADAVRLKLLAFPATATSQVVQALEGLLVDGWVVGALDPALPRDPLPLPSDAATK